MTADSVTRRCVIKGVGCMTSVGVVGKSGSGGSFGVSEQPGKTTATTGYGVSAPPSDIKFRWQVLGNPRLSGVAVAGSTVYASDERVLYALSATDGTEQWSVGDTHWVGSPAVGGEVVYVGCTPVSTDSDPGYLRAVSSETGAEAWRFTPGQPVTTLDTPTVANGIVYTIGHSEGGGTAGRLYALDGETGDLLWFRETGTSGISGYEAPPVAVRDGVVYLAGNELTAFDGETGTVYWSVDPEGTYKAAGTNAPAVADGRLYVGRGTERATTFESRSVTDGSLVWTHTVSEHRTTQPTARTSAPMEPLTGVWTAPAVVGESVYVGFNERAPHTHRLSLVVALRSDDGTVRWQTAFTDDRHPVYTPASANQTLYTGGAALSLDNGAIRWRLDGPPNQIDTFAPPTIADETVYVGGTKLRAIE